MNVVQQHCALPQQLALVQNVGNEMAEALPDIDVRFKNNVGWFNVKDILIVQGKRTVDTANKWITRHERIFKNEPALFAQLDIRSEVWFACGYIGYTRILSMARIGNVEEASVGALAGQVFGSRLQAVAQPMIREAVEDQPAFRHFVSEVRHEEDEHRDVINALHQANLRRDLLQSIPAITSKDLIESIPLQTRIDMCKSVVQAETTKLQHEESANVAKTKHEESANVAKTNREADASVEKTNREACAREQEAAAKIKHEQAMEAKVIRETKAMETKLIREAIAREQEAAAKMKHEEAMAEKVYREAKAREQEAAAKIKHELSMEAKVNRETVLMERRFDNDTKRDDEANKRQTDAKIAESNARIEAMRAETVRKARMLELRYLYKSQNAGRVAVDGESEDEG